MGTRIKKHPDHIFEVLCEVGIPSDGNKSAWLNWKYPLNYKQQDVLKSVPEFAYPVEFHDNVVQHFSFVLTNCDSKWTFGFCRHVPNSMSCIVILSYLPWHETFYRILNYVAELTNKEKPANCKPLHNFLESLLKSKIPDPGFELCINYDPNEKFVVSSPDHNKLPSIPENRNITEYFNAVDSHNMMNVYASMLHERRILIVSKKLNRLSACVQAANSLIFPMHWQHIFIPVLPKHLLDYLSAPMPFLIGVPASTFARMRHTDMGDVVIIDADINNIESPYADVDALPSDVLQNLRNDLKKPQEMLGDSLARAFLRASVRLIGGYWNALRLRPGEKISFSSELFVLTRPPPMQPFLEKMLQLQIFQQFIESRLKMLNSGQGVSDEFEFELTAHEDQKSKRFQTQYKEWVTYMKKEGFAIFKHVKVKVRDTSKKAYKDIRSIIHERHHHKMGNDDGPSSVKNGKIDRFNIKPSDSDNNNKVKSKIAALAVPEDDCISSSSSDKNRSTNESPLLNFDPIDTDLMSDMHDWIFKDQSKNHNLPLAQQEQLVNRESSRFESPPPLLPRPPAKSNLRSASVPQRNRNVTSCAETPLITLDDEFRNIEINNNPNTIQSNGNDHASNPFRIEARNLDFGKNELVFKSTNPFLRNDSPVFGESKVFTGPNVRQMIDHWQANSPETGSNGLNLVQKTNAEKPKQVPYRSQPILQDRKPVYGSKNPFLNPNVDSMNNSKNGLYETSQTNANSIWENFQ